ncbi:hypothetical protein [Streptomyces sp. TP-A0874]|uniref:hypothetical protein n=1 Tax=Streptomyces sp. TP-A0874 TaxID=549819 RepID=UPI000852AC00|nr:hypothetical protein [Streptomyces sp. TP-A0874]
MLNTFKRALVLTAAGAALTGALGATAAAAETTVPAKSMSIRAKAVTTWVQGNVRRGPSTDYHIAYKVKANQKFQAVCWLTGGWVDANNIRHNKWVRLADGNYIWGGLLRGNQTGGVSTKC